MFDSIIAAVDWSDVGVAVLAVSALIATVFVVWRGVQWILWVIRGRPYYKDYRGRITDTLPPGW